MGGPSRERAAPEPEGGKRWLTGAVLFAVGFGLGIRALAGLAPTPEPPIIAVRLAELEANRDAYDTLFFGSSRIFRGLDPVVFDARTAELGRPTHSFNLGFPAMRPHEANALLRRVLAEHRPANLRTVLIELDDWQSEVLDPLPGELFVDVGRFSARAVKWHDAAETLSVARTLWRSRDPFREKLERAGFALLHFGAHALHVGNAASALRDDGAVDPALETGARRGFTPFAEEDYVEGFPARWRRAFVEAAGLYRLGLEGRAEANAAEVPIDHYNLPALEAQIARVRAAGASPVYVLPPRGDATPHLYQLAARGHVPALLEVGDPTRYPELFAFEARFDTQHLKPEAARAFSRAVADQFVRWQGGR